jgi:hypothetical protein
MKEIILPKAVMNGFHKHNIEWKKQHKNTEWSVHLYKFQIQVQLLSSVKKQTKYLSLEKMIWIVTNGTWKEPWDLSSSAFWLKCWNLICIYIVCIQFYCMYVMLPYTCSQAGSISDNILVGENFLSWHLVPLCSSGWHETQDPPASVFWVLGLQDFLPHLSRKGFPHIDVSSILLWFTH